jgi:hypothetical protein
VYNPNRMLENKLLRSSVPHGMTHATENAPAFSGNPTAYKIYGFAFVRFFG